MNKNFKYIIKNELNRIKFVDENFDWAIKDIKPFLEVLEPLTLTNPKNKYRIYSTHGHGEENSIWADNWIDIGVDKIDDIIRIIKILNLPRNRDNAIDESVIVNLWMKGERWVLSEDTNNHIDKIIKEEGWDINDENDKEHIIEIVEENVNEDLRDNGFLEYNNYYDSYAPIERWRVTFFDEFGVEHKVKVNDTNTNG